MPVNNDYKTPPKNVPNDDPYIRQLRDAATQAMNGKLNCCGEKALANGATSTAINDPLCNPNSVILLSPTTAAAAAVTGLYVVAGTGAFVIHHADPASTTAVFRYVIIG